MQRHPFMLGRVPVVGMGQIPNWGPATSFAPMGASVYMSQAQAPVQALPPAEPKKDISSTLYAGGVVVAIMAALGALLS